MLKDFYEVINDKKWDSGFWEKDAFAAAGFVYDHENKLHTKLAEMAYDRSHCYGVVECAGTLKESVANLRDVIPSELWGEVYDPTAHDIPNENNGWKVEWLYPSEVNKLREDVLDELVAQAQELDMGYNN